MKDIPRHNLKILLDEQTIERTRENLSSYSIQHIIDEIIPIQKEDIDKASKEGLLNLILLRKHELANMERVLEERMQQEGIEALPLKKQLTTGTAKGQQPKLTVKQVALIRFYNGEPVTNANKIEVAKEYGHNSGKIYTEYCNYSNRVNRIAKPDQETRRTLENKIKLFEEIESYIINKNKFDDDLNILKGHRAQFPEK